MWTGWSDTKTRMIARDQALAGRDEPMALANRHAVHGKSIKPPFPAGVNELVVGMGCFWGAEQRFWGLDGVYTTAVGYAGGYTPNPTYEEVCSGRTGHAEVVRVIYDPERISLDGLLKVFWESHDPTQGMRQGNDVGTQYRSALYLPDDDSREIAERSRRHFQEVLGNQGLGEITTELAVGVPFFYAEEEHQQYLHKHPGGYCGLKGTGVSY